MNKKILSVFILMSLGGCAESNHDDIKIWMKEQEKQLKGKIELLPPAKSFTPVPYNAEIDPFTVKEKVKLADLLKDKYAPDTKREQEYLEDFPLDKLKMIGTVIKDGKFFAMILDPNKSINYVAVNNYMGKNYGKITKISEGEILLEERVKINEAWVIQPTKILLHEGNSSK